MIVKVQMPLASSMEVPKILIYNKKKDVWFQFEPTREWEKKMAGRPKAFFYAKLVGTIIEVAGPAPWQEW